MELEDALSSKLLGHMSDYADKIAATFLKLVPRSN